MIFSLYIISLPLVSFYSNTLLIRSTFFCIAFHCICIFFFLSFYMRCIRPIHLYFLNTPFFIWTHIFFAYTYFFSASLTGSSGNRQLYTLSYPFLNIRGKHPPTLYISIFLFICITPF